MFHFPFQDVRRGIHISKYAKLLTCVTGVVYDVVIDMRQESATYLKWAAVILTDTNCRQLLVPPGCGHAYYSLQEHSIVVYCQVRLFVIYTSHKLNYFKIQYIRPKYVCVYIYI